MCPPDSGATWIWSDCTVFPLLGGLVRNLLAVASLSLFITQTACMDGIAPIDAQTAELQNIQSLLRTALERLDTLEARDARRAQELLQRLDTLEATEGRRSAAVLASLDTLVLSVGQPGDPGSLIRQVLERMDTLEAREAGRSQLALERLDTLSERSSSLLADLDTLTVAFLEPEDPGSLGVQLEATLCFERSRNLTGQAESKVQVDGKGTGTVGVDAEGNGAKATVNGAARQVVQLTPKAEWAFKGTICGKGYGDYDLGSLRDLIEGMLNSVSAASLAGVGTSVDMTGTRMNSSLTSVSGLSMSQFPFGGGAAADVINSLPLPSDLADLLQNPSGILDRAAAAGQYAIDRLCGQTLFTGEFAERAAAACDLRNTLSVEQFLTIFQGLNGLPSTVSQIGANLNSVCDGVNLIRQKRLIIPSYTVAFPLGIGDVQVFPGYNQLLFPTQGAVC